MKFRAARVPEDSRHALADRALIRAHWQDCGAAIVDDKKVSCCLLLSFLVLT